MGRQRQCLGLMTDLIESDIVESDDLQDSETSQEPWWRPLINNQRNVLVMLFFATAAPGLPLLWISKAFSWREKIVWSVLVLIYTVLILWGFFLLMMWVYNRLKGVVL